uniref:PPIase cyclophilin-type domain-containing protein n=1 Tax=Timema shepardi TaxID=629360 RepID=A0A7R9G164_TIMSH|nr:unnamed protein product [Timema shepardi]
MLIIFVNHRCYFDIELATNFKLGRIVFELYSDYVPKAAANFLSLCKGDTKLSYKNTKFQQIIPGYLCQGGYVELKSGSFDRENYEDNNFKLKHSGPGEFFFHLLVEEAMPCVDNKAPRLNVDAFLKMKNNINNNLILKSIVLENKKLLQRINIINRTHGQESNYSMRVQECDYQRSQQYSRLFSKYLSNAARQAEKRPVTLQYSLMNQAQLSLVMPVRPRCFLDVKAEDGFPLGRMIVELYSDRVPKTALNFLSLCKGDSGWSYRNSPFHCILPPLLCQAGDVVRFDGHGGTSIYGDTFPDENFDLKHVGPGILSMVSVGTNTNNSKFNISFKPIVTLNNKCVVFGRLVKGFKTLRKPIIKFATIAREAKTVEDSREAKHEENSREAKHGENSREVKPGEDSREAKHGEDSREVKPGEDSREAKPGEDSREAKHGEDSREAKPGEDSREAKPGEDSREAKPGENSREAKSGEDSREAKHGEDSKEAKPGEDSREAKPGEDSREAKPGEDSREAKPGEDSRETKPGEDSREAKTGEDSSEANPGEDSRKVKLGKIQGRLNLGKI